MVPCRSRLPPHGSSTSKISGGREAAAAAGRLRLHRRRGGPRDHAARNCAPTTSSTFRPRCAVATPTYDLRTTVLGTPRGDADPPRARRQLAACSTRAAKRSRRAPRDGGHGLHPVDAVGLPAGGCPEGDDRPGLVSALSRRRPRRRDRAASSARARPATPRSSSPSTRPSPGMRERDLRNGMKELLSRAIP